MHERLSRKTAEAQATPARSGPAPAAPGTPAGVLQLQRQAGNRAVVAAMRQAQPQVLARCSGTCSCGSCEDEMLLGPH